MHYEGSIKKLWDEDTAQRLNLKVMLLGSATLLIQTGLGESLAGRFELIPCPHWSFEECRDAFHWTLERYIYFGGYPGSALLIQDEDRWSRYIVDSIIETSISRDVMLMTRIHKPALLRRVFELGCHYTGHVLSYQKMLGQLQDAGNVSTLAHVWTGDCGQDVFLLFFQRCTHVSGLNSAFKAKSGPNGICTSFLQQNFTITTMAS